MATEEHFLRALNYARRHGGKIEVTPKVPVHGLEDFATWYTPGVAAVSRAIQAQNSLSFEYTNRWNTIAIITDGSRVLGLGDVGPEAALPVMEGKALLFKYLGGVDAFPLPINARTSEAMVEVVEALQPALGGINLEDIESPRCFHVLEELRKRLHIPVWHDDQLGTAGIVLAALLAALKVTGRGLQGSRITLLGSGAANIATARILAAAGADRGDLIMVDRHGILHPEREDMDQLLVKNPWKYDMAIRTNRGRVKGGLREALQGADALIAASTPGPEVIRGTEISVMAPNPIVFALANPVPEILPEEAVKAGAAVVATGRSDYPNQVNNSLLFPAVFRGVLDVRAKAIVDEMVVAAAQEMLAYTEETGLKRDRIVPSMQELEVYPRLAAAVGDTASRLGLARRPLAREEIYQEALATIERARSMLRALMEGSFVPPPSRT